MMSCERSHSSSSQRKPSSLSTRGSPSSCRGRGQAKAGNTSGWALADFDSGLRVTIMGFTIEEERTYRTAPLELPTGGEPLGTWMIEDGFLKSPHYDLSTGWPLVLSPSMDGDQRASAIRMRMNCRHRADTY